MFAGRKVVGMDESVASEMLAAHADRLNAGDDRSEDYLRLFPETDADLAELMALAVRVRQGLAPVYPTLQFRETLRRDLLAAYQQQLLGMPMPVWVTWRADAEFWMEYARRHLPEWSAPQWPERPVPRRWVLAALGLTGAGMWAYLRRREEQRRDMPAAQ